MWWFCLIKFWLKPSAQIKPLNKSFQSHVFSHHVSFWNAMVCLHSVLWWCTLHKVGATGAVTVKKQQCGSSHGAEALRLKCGNLCGQHLRSIWVDLCLSVWAPRMVWGFRMYEFLAFSTLPLLTNIPSDLVGSFFANCTRDALYKNKNSAMLGMLEMARWISRSAPTTSSKLVIKMGRSFTTTVRMALLSMAASLQSFCKVYMWLLVWILCCLSTIIKEDTTRQCMFAVIVAMLAPAVGVLQTTKFICKLWDKLRNFLAGPMSMSISSAPPWSPWVISMED